MGGTRTRRAVLRGGALCGTALLGIGSASGACTVIVSTNDETEGGNRRLLVPPASAPVVGASSCPPGTTLQVVVRHPRGEFVRTEPAGVQPDGTFSATFDFGEFEAGTPFVIEVLNGNDALEHLERASVEADAEAMTPPTGQSTPDSTSGDAAAGTTATASAPSSTSQSTAPAPGDDESGGSLPDLPLVGGALTLGLVGVAALKRLAGSSDASDETG